MTQPVTPMGNNRIGMEFTNAYNAAHREGRYYSRRAEEIITGNGGIIVTTRKSDEIEDEKP